MYVPCGMRGVLFHVPGGYIIVSFGAPGRRKQQCFHFYTSVLLLPK